MLLFSDIYYYSESSRIPIKILKLKGGIYYGYNEQINGRMQLINTGIRGIDLGDTPKICRLIWY